MSELDDIRKRWDANYYSDMEIWDLAEDLLRISTEQEAELAEAVEIMKELPHLLRADSERMKRLGHERHCGGLTRAIVIIDERMRGFLARQEENDE